MRKVAVMLAFSLFLMLPLRLAFANDYRDSIKISRQIVREVSKAKPSVMYRDDVSLRKLEKELGSKVIYIPDQKGKGYLKTFEEVVRDEGGDCEDLTNYILTRLIQMGVSKSSLGFQIWRETGKKTYHVEPLIWLRRDVYSIRIGGHIDAKLDMEKRKSSLTSLAVVRLDDRKIVFKNKDEISNKIYQE